MSLLRRALGLLPTGLHRALHDSLLAQAPAAIEAARVSQAVLARPEEELSWQCTAELQKLLATGDLSMATTLFDRLLAARQANTYHLGVMLKACSGSDVQRALLRRAEEGGVVPDVSTYNVMLGRLRIEGRGQEVAELRAEMQRRGIEPDKLTHAVLARPEEELSRQRTAELVRLLTVGDKSAADALFGGLASRGVADHYQRRVMRGRKRALRRQAASHGKRIRK